MLETFIEGGFEASEVFEVPRVWEALFEDGFAPAAIVRRMKSGSNAEWLAWAWSPRFRFDDQDEDILELLDASQTLLELAKDQACPKRDYMLACAVHGVRDRVHASSLEPSAFDEARSLIVLARSARAPELVDYFERLAGYAKKGSVDRDEAIQRGHDLHRCAPPRSEDVRVHVDGEFWRVHYTLRSQEPDMLIHRRTGAMTRSLKTGR